ncbi:right-handed parallel beta-helix repeat-containing protein [Paenibacillus sp. LHD-117]|uniref:right-handed parallel beta-helix repeat-containing protein n=1 Tax=Paenibacillus sp. LHD-117 TaxID=3071412 RepID=UPI0027E18DDF|nr:right-handed parallel beta-helix repeat-containing protein [Paenibacillus sp. LHD-117]MDQ6420555.1 right-handed parallel beta-helix repeat-containing protein [Paenibacillus sp. LHD-117]
MSHRIEIKEDGLPEIFRVTDYGAVPDSGKDATMAVKRTIAAASAAKGAAIIEFPKGRYDLYPDEAEKALYYVSNTASEAEHPDPVKTIGLLIKGASRLRVEGNGSLLLFHGKMTPFVLDGCNDAEITNLEVDFARPTMSEMRVDAAGDSSWDVTVHPESRYALQEGRLFWIGEDWSYRSGPAQAFDPAVNRTWRVPNPVTLADDVEELEPGKLRLRFAEAPATKVGCVYQMRDGIRDQVGTLLIGCRNVTLRNVWYKYMHGLGIVGQFSENVRLEKLRLAPDPESGRTAAAFADFVHLSGLKGVVSISDCLFEGAHDDAINVHGTHLRIVGVEGGNRLRLRFMHHQSYGFNAFREGDEVDFVSVARLTAYATRRVTSAQRLGLREMEIELDAPVPDGIEEGDVIENVTWTPEVYVRGNVFRRIPTRGVLVTTRRKVEIERNRFEGLGMSAILIADDAGSWFESGMVRDVRIWNNDFVGCGGGSEPVIYIHPENTDVAWEHPVHFNIAVLENRFEWAGTSVVEAKSTCNLVIMQNKIDCRTAATALAGRPLELIRLHACSGVAIAGNWIVGHSPASVAAASMETEQLMMEEGFVYDAGGGIGV